MCKKLGKLTANYRWFAIVYILFMFFVLPGIFMGLSFVDEVGITMYTFLALLVLLILSVALLNYLQSHEKFTQKLPEKLQNWHFLSEGLRSLDPYDR